MRILGNGSIDGVAKAKSSMQKLRAMSKYMELGTNYRIFLSLCKPEGATNSSVVAAGTFGRKLDFEKLGGTFIAIDDYEEDAVGAPVDKSPLVRWAKFARVWHLATAEQKIQLKKRELEMEAENTGKDVDQIALAQAIKAIQNEYLGDQDAKPAVYADKKPMIGGGCIYGATEALIVPLTSDNKPILEKMEYATLDLNDKKIAQIRTVIRNPLYVTEGDTYLELGYSYTGESKKVAGQNAAFSPVGASEKLKVIAADKWPQVTAKLDGLARTVDQIVGRNMTFASNMTVPAVIASIKKYVSMNVGILACMDFESDDVKESAPFILENQLASTLPKIQERLIALAESYVDKAAEEPAEDSSVRVADVEKAKNAQNIEDLADVNGLSDLSDL